MAAVATIDLDSENLVTLTGFKDEITKTYPANATVTASLFTAAGAAVTGAQNVAMAYVTGTTGSATKYRGEFPYTVVLVKDALYNCKILAIAAGGKRHVFPINGIVAKG